MRHSHPRQHFTSSTCARKLQRTCSIGKFSTFYLCMLLLHTYRYTVRCSIYIWVCSFCENTSICSIALTFHCDCSCSFLRTRTQMHSYINCTYVLLHVHEKVPQLVNISTELNAAFTSPSPTVCCHWSGNAHECQRLPSMISGLSILVRRHTLYNLYSYLPLQLLFMLHSYLQYEWDYLWK